MRTHANHLGSNPDLDNVNQFIATELLQDRVIKGYGKRGHGMNGKDADLDEYGQCIVEEMYITDPVHSETMFIEMKINRYASICTPTDDDEVREEKLQNMAEEIVMCACEYSGEWTGSDYWQYDMQEIIRVPLSVEEYENPNLDELAQRCSNAIEASKEGKDFEKFATDLNKSIDELYKIEDLDLE